MAEAIDHSIESFIGKCEPNGHICRVRCGARSAISFLRSVLPQRYYLPQAAHSCQCEYPQLQSQPRSLRSWETYSSITSSCIHACQCTLRHSSSSWYANMLLELQKKFLHMYIIYNLQEEKKGSQRLLSRIADRSRVNLHSQWCGCIHDARASFPLREARRKNTYERGVFSLSWVLSIKYNYNIYTHVRIQRRPR